MCQSEISPWLCMTASCEEFVECLWKKTRCLWSVFVVRPGWQWWFWIGRAGLRWLFGSAQLDAFLWRQKLRLLEVTSRRNNFTLEAIRSPLTCRRYQLCCLRVLCCFPPRLSPSCSCTLLTFNYVDFNFFPIEKVYTLSLKSFQISWSPLAISLGNRSLCSSAGCFTQHHYRPWKFICADRLQNRLWREKNPWN